MSILRMIKSTAQSMRRMKLLKSRFFPISKKVHLLPYIHHLRSVNCFIFVKFWPVKAQQHLYLMLMIILSCKVWNVLGFIIWKKLKRKKNRAHYKLLSKKIFFVLPEQIFYPDVPVSEELTLDTKDYQFLSDCIWFNYLQFMTIILTFDS